MNREQAFNSDLRREQAFNPVKGRGRVAQLYAALRPQLPGATKRSEGGSTLFLEKLPLFGLALIYLLETGIILPTLANELTEAEKLGFKKCILPKNNLKSRTAIKTKTLEIVPVSTVREALDHLSR